MKLIDFKSLPFCFGILVCLKIMLMQLTHNFLTTLYFGKHKPTIVGKVSIPYRKQHTYDIKIGLH